MITVNGEPCETRQKTVFALRDEMFPGNDIVIANGKSMTEDAPLAEGMVIFFGKSPSGNGSLREARTCRNVPSVKGKLEHATVGIAGCGGLGSNIAMFLARSGIGNLVIADFDKVDLSNLNRQNFYLEDLGKYKVDAAKERLHKIDPDMQITTFRIRLDEDSIPRIFAGCDVLCEALDNAEGKAMLLSTAMDKMPDVPIVCGNGMAGMEDPGDMVTRRFSDTVYLCGDGNSDVSVSEGIMAPRVGICAGLMANKVLQILAASDKDV